MINRFLKLTAIATVCLATSPCPAESYQNSRSEFDAKIRYWNSFDQFAHTQQAKIKAEQDALLTRLKAAAAADTEEMKAEKQKSLEAAIANYQAAVKLKQDPGTRDRSLLGLAQTEYELAELDAKSANSHYKNAIAALQDHAQDYPSSDHVSMRLMLESQIRSRMDPKGPESKKILQQLASMSGNSEAVIYANLNLGDLAFENEDANQAIKFYEKVLTLLDQSKASSHSDDLLTTRYRLAWATYRTAKLEQSIGYARQVMMHPNQFRNDDELIKIKADAADIMGNALFELNNDSVTAEYIKMISIKAYAPAVATAILGRYIEANLSEDGLTFCKQMLTKFPTSIEVPFWLAAQIDFSRQLKQDDDLIDAEESYVHISRSDSLWYKKNLVRASVLRSVQKVAVDVGTDVISRLMKRARESHNNADLNRASVIASSLIKAYPQSESKAIWMALRAEVLYDLERYAEACALGDTILNEQKLKVDALEKVMYQRSLCSERRWNQKLSELVQANINISEHPDVKSALIDLETQVNLYANRFPSRQRGIDLLLVAASSLRDSGQLSNARKYWERVLLAKSSPSQRALAIRGSIFAAMKESSKTELVELTERFLKMEDWKELGSALRSELLAVMSQSTMDAGGEFAKEGQMMSAGVRMLQSATLVDDLPKREKIYRDGAYMLAVAGDWDSAKKAADDYLAQPYQQQRGDMLYLQARALEYQMQFNQAAQSYMTLAQTFPTHAKAVASIQRAEQLAAGEADYVTAIAAARELAKEERIATAKLAALERAFQYAIQSNDTKSAFAISEEFAAKATDPRDLLNSRLMKSKSLRLVRKTKEASNELYSFNGSLKQYRKKLSAKEYAGFLAESNLMLADIQSQEFSRELNGSSSEDHIREHTRRFDQTVRSYDNVINSRLPSAMSQARFAIAQLAEDYANYIDKTSNASSSMLSHLSQRLNKMATRYHSDNVLAKKQFPEAYRKDEWVRLSSLKMNKNLSDSSIPLENNIAPVVSSDIPSAWSIE